MLRASVGGTKRFDHDDFGQLFADGQARFADLAMKLAWLVSSLIM
jgi:hypothetical protein